MSEVEQAWAWERVGQIPGGPGDENIPVDEVDAEALVEAGREIAALQTENSDLRKAIAALEAAAKARDQR